MNMINNEYTVHPLYIALLKPIKGENPAGLMPCQHKDYEAVASELNKIGTLYHEDIQWHQVEKKALYLLEYECKDIMLFTGFILSQLSAQENSPLFLILTLINGFMQTWREQAHPSIKSVKGQRHWSNRLNQIARYLKSPMQKRFFSQNDKMHLGLCQTLIKTLKQDENINPSELIANVRRLQEKLTKLADLTSTPYSSSNSLTNPTHSTTGYVLEAKKLRNYCQDLIRHQSTIDAYHPMVYRLRRYMLWNSIDALPDADETGKTVLFAPPTDLRNEYQQQLNKVLEITDWQRLEASLENSPYWLSGHHLSYQYALKLNQPHIAQAIREETRAFAQRFNTITSLRFADKGASVCFIDAACEAWLNSDTTAETSKNQQQSDNKADKASDTPTTMVWIIDSPLPASLADAVQAALHTENLARALALIEHYLQQNLEPRSHFYAQLVQAELYEQSQLTTMAQFHYQQLWLQLQTQHQGLAAWEPQLLHHLQRKCRQWQPLESEVIQLPR